MSRCKCPKSDVPKREEQCPPYFDDITVKMEERRCDLVGRHKHLREKITTMERSIPALMAYNMWMSKKCEDAPYCKVRQIMQKFAPKPDQTEKLLSMLKKNVMELNGETEELHEKIIQADVKLEEAEMELESLELANKEMTDTVHNLEREVRRYTTPSLHSIHSEDVLCLTKMRQLAEEELSLKHCIKDLEKKETIFKEHMDRLLTCKEYQNACAARKPIYCAQDLACCGNSIYCAPKKCLLQCGKKDAPLEEDITVQTDVDISTSTEIIAKKQDPVTKPKTTGGCLSKCKSSWISTWWKSNKKSEQTSQEKKADSSTEKEKTASCSPLSQGEEKANNDKASTLSKAAQCQHPCSDSKNLQRILESCVGKFIPPCSVPCDIPCNIPCNVPCNIPCNVPCNIPCKKSFKGCATGKLLCKIPRCAVKDHGIRMGCKTFPPLCNLRGPCEMCPSMPCKNIGRPAGNCRCNCKGKCAHGLSDAECNCNDDLLPPLEQYQPTGSKQLTNSLKGESNSDDEFCECCSCGCEDSDEGLLCECN